ncbi:peptidase S8/S53 domain-containing protein [Cladorrhinum sp. PSN332]|nr:peptidase S8/S53 domain-containing protein [Cladorrhinum sp. PSN332]
MCRPEAMTLFYKRQDEARELFWKRLYEDGMKKWERACDEISQEGVEDVELTSIRNQFVKSLLEANLNEAAQMVFNEIPQFASTNSPSSRDATNEDLGAPSTKGRRAVNARAVNPWVRHQVKLSPRSRQTFGHGQTSPRMLNESARSSTMPARQKGYEAEDARPNHRRAETVRVPMTVQDGSECSNSPQLQNSLVAASDLDFPDHQQQQRPRRHGHMSKENGTMRVPPGGNGLQQPYNTAEVLHISASFSKQHTDDNRRTNDLWFSRLESRTHPFIHGPNREFWPRRVPGQPFRTVKIAVLDSGVLLKGRMATSYKGRIKGRKDFTLVVSPPSRDGPVDAGQQQVPQPQPVPPPTAQQCLDENGHGTAVVYQVIRTCPSAEIYIGKVVACRDEDSLGDVSREAAARAIRHAATPVSDGGWGVDIINMSFGWVEADLPTTTAPPHPDQEVDSSSFLISKAISYAATKGVLMFASATNYGMAEANDVFYPARDHQVISVDAEDGQGNPAPFAKRMVSGGSSGASDRFCAPGLGASCPLFPDQSFSGSSFACPVAVGIAGLVLDFARQEPLNGSESVARALTSPHGMSKILRKMSNQSDGHQSFKSLYPWKLFEYRDERLSPWGRNDVAWSIIKCLETEFGIGKVGHEIYDKFGPA